MKKLIFLLALVFFLAGCSEDIKTNQMRERKAAGLETCGENQILFTTPPLAFDDFFSIVPLGNLAPSGHVIPTRHLYFDIRKTVPGDFRSLPAEVPVYAPADITITRIASVDSSNKPEFSDFAVHFSPCREFRAYFDHVKTLSPEIQQAFDNAPSEECHEYTLHYNDGPVEWKYCDKGVNIKVKEGQQIGTAGGGRGQLKFDFGTFDFRIEPHEFANPERWKHREDDFYVVCPLDYFENEQKAKMKALLGRVESGNLRTIEPRCGTVAQDIKGTAQGVWVPPGPDGIGPENPYIALVHDNIDPTIAVFSLGLSVDNIDFGTYSFAPRAGMINRDFSEIIPSEVYCFEGLTARFQEDLGKIILLQLTSPTELSIEVQDSAECGGEWAFSSPNMFER